MEKYSLEKAQDEAIEMQKIIKHGAANYAEAEKFLEAEKRNNFSNPEGKVQYDSISKEYVAITETDPSKLFVQYPEALRLLGEISGEDILDIGCGNGYFTKKLAERGAIVTGYDNSEEQIKKALLDNEEDNLPIVYLVSSPEKFKSTIEFDKAVSVLVLLYASSKKELGEFFASTYNHLAESGKFVAITFNPKYKRLGEVHYDRRFSRGDDGKMKVEFMDRAGKTKFPAFFTDFSAEDYEKASTQAGFKNFRWEKLKIDPKGIEQVGSEFWDGYEDDCPYIGLVAEK